MPSDDQDRQDPEALAAMRHMEDALVRTATGMTPYFHVNILRAGAREDGEETGPVARSTDRHWPLRAAFSDREFRTERFLADGEWAACFGHIEATHSGEFMGIAPTGKRVCIPFMDYWRVAQGRVPDNPVFLDIARVLRQLGGESEVMGVGIPARLH